MTTDTATTTTTAPAADAAVVTAPVTATTETPATEAPKTDTTQPAAQTPPVDAPKADDAAKKDDAAKADDAKKDEGKKPTGAPEGDYAAFDLGENVSINPETMTGFTALAKKHNLSQEAAAEFAALGAGIARGFAPATEKMVVDMNEQFIAQSKADPEIGGPKYEENMVVAKKALDTFFDVEFVKFLDDSKLGNHPALLRGFKKIGLRIGEDKMFTGDAPNQATKNASDVLYGAPKKTT